jgi:hypothetical protein
MDAVAVLRAVAALESTAQDQPARFYDVSRRCS